MNVVDSSAWLAYFADEKHSAKFAQAIEFADELLVPSVIITEVFKHVLRHRGENEALQIIAHMSQAKVIDLDTELAISAASFGHEYKLPLADSIIYASAAKYDATLWTQDSDFEGLPNVEYFAK
ncbi:MAG: type II toxin-antitoxin system VapC family toxin [Enterobacterales bacterium]|nr:type II toxin-antitoxin system VapC family toxin [Enterobacterales bacterium]